MMSENYENITLSRHHKAEMERLHRKASDKIFAGTCRGFLLCYIIFLNHRVENNVNKAYIFQFGWVFKNTQLFFNRDYVQMRWTFTDC